jgi:hypothetical protein
MIYLLKKPRPYSSMEERNTVNILIDVQFILRAGYKKVLNVLTNYNYVRVASTIFKYCTLNFWLF